MKKTANINLKYNRHDRELDSILIGVMNERELIQNRIEIDVDEYLERNGFEYHPIMNEENGWMHDWSEVAKLMGEEIVDEYINAYNTTLEHYESYMSDLIDAKAQDEKMKLDSRIKKIIDNIYKQDLTKESMQDIMLIMYNAKLIDKIGTINYCLDKHGIWLENKKNEHINR